ncbi:unnamed protein product [Porites lobata]|uniref:NACHT domain-containing protein n=1 Tax=Porites lobata TaxID=104759 RepID=A0ABN8SD45_9CNID|nr:unnamed protein product [Porites lobata]
MELKRYHKSGRPKICWDNSDRTQWGSPTGAWEIAKVFMPGLGSRAKDVINADGTDIGGLLNLLEWCPFINPPVSRTLLNSARDECRNRWAHAAKQEICDADVPTILSHLNNLLSDPLFNSELSAQKASNDLQDLFRQGLINVRESEVEALHLLRQCLEADLRKCQDDLAYTLRHLSQVQEQSNANKSEIITLKQQMEEESRNLSENVSTILLDVAAFNKFLNQRDDLRNTIEVICDGLDELSNGIQKVVMELNAVGLILPQLESNLINLYCEVQKVAKNVSTNKSLISRLREDVMEVKEEVKTLKHKAQVGSQKGDDDDDDILYTAPTGLTEFTGRKSELEWLERSLVLLNPEKKPGNTSCIKTICGLGGCGKTSLAIEFAWRYKHRFPGGVFWVNGESDENVRKSVVEMLTFVNISASVNDNIEDILNKFLSWLSKLKRPWLLVIDNADELNDPTCPAGVKKICKGMLQRTHLPRKHGHILVTTRANATQSRTFLKISNDDCLELQCFSEKEGALFLMQRSGLGGNDLDPEAICLAKELGSLPLALEQAAAYISSSPLRLNFKDYLDRYKGVRLHLLKQQHATALSLEAQHRLSIHTTWLMNFEYVKEKSPAAAKIMRISAFLESEFIPFNVINPGFPEFNQKEVREGLFSYSDIGDILKILSSYSLFTVDNQCKLFRVHKLVQEVVRESLTESERIKTLVECVRVLRFAFLQFPVFENFKLGNLYELDVGDQRIVLSLLLHFLKLTSYMEEEINVPRENDNGKLFSDDAFELCKFVYNLTKKSNSLSWLNCELSNFYLKLLKVVYGDSEPNLLLFEMINAGISKVNSFTVEGTYEGKNLIESAMQKMFEFEKSGVVIEADIKFYVLFQKAQLFLFEGELEKSYNGLLELESSDLPISEADTAELQMKMAMVEYRKGNKDELVFKRLMKSLEMARRLYPWDHPMFLQVLECAIFMFSSTGKFKEAEICAKEMRDINMKLPPSSDDMMMGLRNHFSLMCQTNHVVMETYLLERLENRWPHIYSCIKDGYVNNCIPYVDDGSEETVAIFLLSIMRCLSIAFNAESEPNLSAEKLTMYLRIGEIFVSLRLKYYGSNFPDMREVYSFLAALKLFQGTDEKGAFVCRQVPVLVVNRQGFSEQYQSGPCADSSVNESSRYRDAGNGFFSLGDYSRSLEFYNKALNLNQGDAKLLTNRVVAQVKLSKQKAQSQHLKEQQNILQRALQDSISAISADPSWVKGYYWKAVCLAELGQRGASLAAAAVAESLFPLQWAQIPAVVEHFGCYIVKDVATSEDLGRAVEITENSLVIVVRSGKYVLTQPLKVPSNAVIVGLGKVEITCVKGVPLFLDKTVYIDNIELTPSAEFIRMNKEDAKKCLDRGQLHQALSLYSKVLASCPENTQLLTARASTYLKAAKEKSNTCERESLLELGLEDTKSTIRADPSWLLGYSTRAAIMTELGRKHEALASAAVFNHLSSGRDISSVIQRYGALQIHVVENSDELRSFLEEIEEPEGVNQVVLMKEGEYRFENSVQINPAIVVVGLGKVIVSCKTGAPFHFRKEHFVENIELQGDCGDEPESLETASSTSLFGQDEYISLALPSGYDASNVDSECKVN